MQGDSYRIGTRVVIDMRAGDGKSSSRAARLSDDAGDDTAAIAPIDGRPTAAGGEIL